MATIEDVARQAGVSRSTVSYALSGKRTISSDTRRRVQQAISDLGFTPNAGARALATSQTMVLGLLLQFHQDEFAPAMLQYVLPISMQARELGYDILMVTDPDGPSAIHRIADSHMVDGIVLLDVTADDPRLEALRAVSKPGVLLGLARDTRGLDIVDLDFGEAARMLVDHLQERGHRELLLIAPPQHVVDRGGSYAWRFRDAAVERAARYGLQIHVYHGESRQPAIAESVHAVLDAHPGATGLIVHNDATIAALPPILRERGVRVPDDLSVVSLYSRDFGEEFSLPYTAVESAADDLGRQAVSRLIARIASAADAGPPILRFVAPVLRDRGSTR
ncbi:LacI family DNA-binding transcriptional regulator [Phycicoccus flavus]|uniref:LacI family DNA-binding transcriptional regulator n=1 Tax=Phycicoccus flavus TaxID=2502783 RepID=UPI000FEBABF5|nr:LacI family DNA-binding transcriptional regulator [Phycicoccus flavus]NHA68619.1 LacI family transcriptional regulator [Phycicoccus flavus]NHA68682.1 LacI family transcriptional regulator [Phycicoccus flavus]